MKKYIRAAETLEIHLADILTDNVRIIFVSDMSDYNIREITAATNSDYEFISERMLRKMSEEQLAEITDPDTLVRLGRMDYQILTPGQKLIAYKYLSSKVLVEERDVKAVLNLIQSKKHATYVLTDKNEEFVEKYDISADDMLKVVKTLKYSNYKGATRNYIPDFYGDTLLIFRTNKNTPLGIGTLPAGTDIYIKIDIEASLKTTVLLISFHEAGMFD